MTDSTLTRPAGRDRLEAHKSLRVLFVDDEQPLQELMRSELPRSAMRSRSAPTARRP